MCMDLSRRDDLISWFYLSYELIIQDLPWRGLQDKSQIVEYKTRFDVANAVAPVAPELFEVWRHINSLGYSDKPDYDHVKKCLERICKRNGFNLNDPFDWHPYLHEHRQKIAQALETIEATKQTHVEADVLNADQLDTNLLGPRMTIPAPFSHLSQTDDCACCGC